ncbi:MAG: hypothetical protein ACIALR_14025 [Blastopirellula sp. JB062]
MRNAQKTGCMLQAVRVWAVDETQAAGWTVETTGEQEDSFDQDIELRFGQERGAQIEEWEGQVRLAFPCATSQSLRGGVEMIFFPDDGAIAAWELWRRDDRDELKLSAGVYRNLPYIERITPYVRFPRRSGMPGEIWENRRAACVLDLGESLNFMRASGARSAGLTSGVGLPFMQSEFELANVLLLLGSRQTPLFSQVEIWTPDDDSAGLVRTGSIDDAAAKSSPSRLRLGEGLAGYVAAARYPKLVKADDDSTASWHVGVPQFAGNQLSSVVCVSL